MLKNSITDTQEKDKNLIKVVITVLHMLND